jgi:hypothetical protein
LHAVEKDTGFGTFWLASGDETEIVFEYDVTTVMGTETVGVTAEPFAYQHLNAKACAPGVSVSDPLERDAL